MQSSRAATQRSPAAYRAEPPLSELLLLGAQAFLGLPSAKRPPRGAVLAKPVDERFPKAFLVIEWCCLGQRLCVGAHRRLIA